MMNWTPLHNLVLCKEIFFVNPYSAKKKKVHSMQRAVAEGGRKSQ